MYEYMPTGRRNTGRPRKREKQNQQKNAGWPMKRKKPTEEARRLLMRSQYVFPHLPY
jgi:hypothetical protein